MKNIQAAQVSTCTWVKSDIPVLTPHPRPPAEGAFSIHGRATFMMSPTIALPSTPNVVVFARNREDPDSPTYAYPATPGPMACNGERAVYSEERSTAHVGRGEKCDEKGQHDAAYSGVDAVGDLSYQGNRHWYWSAIQRPPAQLRHLHMQAVLRMMPARSSGLRPILLLSRPKKAPTFASMPTTESR
jgi:hypothetical protein